MLQHVVSLKVYRTKFLAAFVRTGLYASPVLPSGSSWIDLSFTAGTASFTEKSEQTENGKRFDSVINFSSTNDSMDSVSVYDQLEPHGLIVLMTYNTGETKVLGSPDYPARLSLGLSTENNSVKSISITCSSAYRTPFLHS